MRTYINHWKICGCNNLKRCNRNGLFLNNGDYRVRLLWYDNLQKPQHSSSVFLLSFSISVNGLHVGLTFTKYQV